MATQEDRERQFGQHAREHRRNRFTANKRGLQIVGEVNSIECAAEVGVRGERIIAAASETGATIVIIPTLRRLGVGTAQTQLRQQIEAAGLTIVSERETENAVLRSEPSPSRELLLAHFAATDEYEWRVNKERVRLAHVNVYDTAEWQVYDIAEWQATLDFIAQREHLKGDQLPRILEARGHKTLTGKPTWTRMQVLRARREIDARNEAAWL